MLKLEFVKNNEWRSEEFETVSDALDRLEILSTKSDIFSPNAEERMDTISGDRDQARELAELLYSVKEGISSGSRIPRAKFQAMQASHAMGSKIDETL